MNIIKKTFLLLLVFATSSQLFILSNPSKTLAQDMSYQVSSVNVGSILQSSESRKEYLFTRNGEQHLLLSFRARHYTNDLEYRLLNLATGENAVIKTTVKGLPSVSAYNIDLDRLYLFTADKGFIIEYDFATENVRTVVTSNDRDVYSVAEGPDGIYYLGGVTKAWISSYNPYTDEYLDLGPAGSTDYTARRLQYVYTIAADDRYIYSGIGQLPWYLSVYDRQTSQLVKYFENDNNSGARVSVRKSDGKIFFSRSNTTLGNAWFEFVNGEPVLTTDPGEMVEGYKGPNTIISRENFGSESDYEFDFSDYLPTNFRNEINIGWKLKTESDWNNVTFNNFDLYPVVIHRMYNQPNSDNTLIISFAYNPVMLLNRVTGELTVLGNTDRSLYDAAFHNGKWYLSGYPAVTFEYDPNLPWTAGGNFPISDPGSNPRQISGYSKYHHFTRITQSGIKFTGVTHQRDSIGATLGWLDLNTGVSGTIRTPFATGNIHSMTLTNNDTKLVLGMYETTTARPRLVVVDVATKIIEKEINFINANSGLFIVEALPGKIFGVGETFYFLVDVATSKVHYYAQNSLSNIYPGLTAVNRRIEMVNGKVVINENRNIVQIDPRTGVKETLFTGSGNITGLYYAGKNDAFVYGSESITRLAMVPQACQFDFDTSGTLTSSDFEQLSLIYRSQNQRCTEESEECDVTSKDLYEFNRYINIEGICGT